MVFGKGGVKMKDINKTVNVTAFRFKKNRELYPKRIEIDGKTITFVDSGLTCNILRGGDMSKILMLTDGLQQFRLRYDNHGGVWTLLSISS
jgi:hypothetical protein